MAVLVNHGGDCCGARHIHTFRDNDVNNTAALATKVREAGENHLLLEVILSNRQTQQSPLLLAKLAELGFVYTSSWTGNHGTPVHRFERTGARLSLNRNGFNWQGMFANETLDGPLPQVVAGRGDLNETIGQLAARFRHNTMHTVVNRNSQFLGQNVLIDYFNIDTRRVIFYHGGERFEYSPTSFERPHAADGPETGPQRHANRGERNPRREPDVMAVRTEYFASFQDGRIRGPFTTVAECRAAYPRVARYVTRSVMSDGNVVSSDPRRFNNNN